MSQEKSLPYFETETFKNLEFPYEGDAFSMAILFAGRGFDPQKKRDLGIVLLSSYLLKPKFLNPPGLENDKRTVIFSRANFLPFCFEMIVVIIRYIYYID